MTKAKCGRAAAAALLLIGLVPAVAGSVAKAQQEPSPPAEGQPKPLVADGFDQGPLYDEYRDVASDLRCPTCTGLSVLESDARFAVQIKDIVKEKVQAGESKEQILKYFTERYGPWILRAPPKTGFNLIAWALPIGLLLAGPPLVWLLVWRKRRVVSTFGVRPTEAIVAEFQARLEASRGRRPGVGAKS
jgi:cytochrome c-type biogenesis protein CcmH